MTTVLEDTRKLKRDIKYLNDTLKAAQDKLQQIETSCQHNWGATVADHIYHKGYHIPGDPPGKGGADHQFPMDVPARTEKRWKRVCLKCGKIAYTQNVIKNVSETPQW